MNPLIKNIINHLVGDLLRKAFFTVGLWLSAKGIGYLTPDSQSNLVDLAVGVIAFIGSIGWSYARNNKALNNKLKLDELTGALGMGVSIQQEKKPLVLPILFGAFLIASMTSCAIVAPFDQAALDSDITIKKEALALVSHGNENASLYANQIAALNTDISSAKAREEGKGKKNWFIQKQWELLTSPDHLLGRYIKDWQAGKIYPKAYVDEELVLIDDAFNQVISAESAKEHK